MPNYIYAIYQPFILQARFLCRRCQNEILPIAYLRKSPNIWLTNNSTYTVFICHLGCKWHQTKIKWWEKKTLKMSRTYMSMNSFIIFLKMTRPLLYTAYISMISALLHVADKCIKYSRSITIQANIHWRCTSSTSIITSDSEVISPSTMYAGDPIIIIMSVVGIASGCGTHCLLALYLCCPLVLLYAAKYSIPYGMIILHDI